MDKSYTRITEAKPYRGPKSFETEDAPLFFGRENETDQVAALLLSTRFSLLHAQSGAGKTSLLNARIMPRLEQNGWTPIRIRLGDDPVAGVRSATLNYLLPDPLADQKALNRIINLLDLDPENYTLGELLDCYDRNLDIRDPRHRELVSPVEIDPAEIEGGDAATANYMPYLSRLLRSSIEISSLNDYVKICAMMGEENAPNSSVMVDESITLTALRELLFAERVRRGHRVLMSQLDMENQRLTPFFQNLFQVFRKQFRNLRLLLVFDQFEEIFTRFYDAGPSISLHADSSGSTQNEKVLDWRLRWTFFRQLEHLYQRGRVPWWDEADERRLLPIRFVVSMRSEYLAKLEPIREFEPELGEHTYQLHPLFREEAEEAIEKPAKIYGYKYDQNCYQAIIEDLMMEERFVEPTHLQIVCEKLWSEEGRKLAQHSEISDSEHELPEVSYTAFEELGRAPGILRGFLIDYINKLELRDRIESLEILTPLITGGRTRNIVSRKALVAAPFRDTARRYRLLNRLVDGTIVRVESRLGNEFVEITHEFLIEPILEAMRLYLAEDPDYRDFRSALQVLELAVNRDFRSDTDNLLGRADYKALDRHRGNVAWTDAACELMFRSAILNDASAKQIRHWSKSGTAVDASMNAEEVLQRLRADKRELSVSEIVAITRERSNLELTVLDKEWILRSVLRHGKEYSDHQENICFWTRELSDARN